MFFSLFVTSCWLCSSENSDRKIRFKCWERTLNKFRGCSECIQNEYISCLERKEIQNSLEVLKL